jgi:HAD superfamily hydrolase (TIGR01509 family)
MYKRFFENKKAAFFDLDGTIIDSLPYWERACRLVLEDISDGTAPIHGISRGTYLRDIWKNTINNFEIKTEFSVDELVKKTQEEYLAMFNELTPEPRDGFWVLADELKNVRKWPLALISNSDRSVVSPVTEKLNLGENVFDLIITGDDMKNRKPAPDIYNSALKQLKLKAAEVIVFEDTVTGAEAAGKAGLDVIVIWRGDVKTEEYPKNVLTFFTDFSTIPGNMDETYLEASKKRLEELRSGSL